jgi:hypothetical protein
MKRTYGVRIIVVALLLTGLSLPSVGCDQELAGQVASLSGGFLGDVVAVAATRYLEMAWGVEVAGGAHEAEEESHDHDAEALHDHEH